MLARLRFWLRALFLRRRLEREMQEEMASHQHFATERLMARGLPEAAAQRAARREFGNLDSLQEEARDARGGRWIESIVADLRFGLRHFGRTPITALTMILLLALGIGFNSALFTLIYSMVNMPTPGIARDESLVRIRGHDRVAAWGRTIGREFSYPEYRAYAQETSLFSAVTAWTSSDVVLASGDEREALQSGAATYVTANYFAVLGVRPILGAGLPVASAADDGAAQLVGVISHAVWDRLYGRAPDVLGRNIRVNDVLVTITGVAPPRFSGTRTGGSQMRVWLPLSARPQVQHTSVAILSSYDSAFFGLAARLRPGVPLERTTAIVQTIAARAQQRARDTSGHTLSADVVTMLGNNYFPPPGDSEDASIIGRLTTLLMPLLILMIPCTNVSALLVGLAVARQREIAVRLALGAARRRIVRQLVTESVLLALAAGVLGLAVIWGLLRLFGVRVPDVQLVLHWPVFAFTFGIALFAGVLFGVSPALHATRVGVADVLKKAAQSVASSRSRLQSGLVVTQIALTIPLLLGLGSLLLELFSDLQRLPVLAHGDRIVLVSFDVNPRYGTRPEDRERILPLLQQRVAALPAVLSVILQQEHDDYVDAAIHPSDRIAGREDPPPFGLRTHGAPAGYFELMGFPFVRGRAFAPGDPENAIVIRSDLARRLWGTADPIGRRLVSREPSRAGTYVVVGVIDEAQAGLSGERDARVFLNTLDNTAGLLVRTHGPAQPVISLIRSIAHVEAPQLPVTSARTLASINAGERSNFNRLLAALLTAGAVALFLCAIGLYAIVAFAVGQRRGEIGIRTALGADPRQVVRMFFLRGLRLSWFGLAIGLAIGALVVRANTLAQGKEMDPGIVLVGVLVATVVAAVASVATWIPARRASRVDPLTMLRVE